MNIIEKKMQSKVLIVEDEKKLALLLHDYLKKSDYIVDIVSDGNEVIDTLNSFKPSIILLDIMLPNVDGISLCKQIRQTTHFKHIPIIMTTAKVEEIDRLLGLEIGADDYICKPYSPREVVARVKAQLRRQHYLAEPDSMGLTLDQEKMSATLNGSKLNLTAVEFTLLSIMAGSPGRIYSRTQLMNEMYSDYRVVSERTIDSHIKKLRKKISDANDSVEIIHSVYGVGYKVEYFES